MNEIDICLFKKNGFKLYDFVIKNEGITFDLPYSLALKSRGKGYLFTNHHKTIEKCFDSIRTFIRYKDPLQKVWLLDGEKLKVIAKTEDGMVIYCE